MYSQKLNAERGYVTIARETKKVVKEKEVMEAEMLRIKEAIGALAQTFPELVVQPEDITEVTVRRVTDLVQSLQGKAEELGARLVPTTPQEVYDKRKNEVQQVVEVMQKTVPENETLLGKVVHTWSTLS